MVYFFAVGFRKPFRRHFVGNMKQQAFAGQVSKRVGEIFARS